MIAILSLIIVLVTSLIIVRVATVSLMLTGMSKDLARFQARSAFTGAAGLVMSTKCRPWPQVAVPTA